MDSRLKLWLGVGIYSLVQTGVPAIDLAHHSDQPASGAAFAAEGGEGGEGGEAGISAEQAAKDPVAFLTALDVIAAHYHAGRDALAAGETTAAAEMFAHPISEIYVALEPVFRDRGVTPFQQLMERATELAADKAPMTQINQAVASVLDALKSAATKAPGKGGLQAEARVLGEMIDRAALQYAAAEKTDQFEPYLDGYGFYMAARSRAESLLPRLPAGSGETAAAVKHALSSLASAYPGALRPKTLANAGPVLANASQAKLSLQRVD